ncbi:MAG TPA: alpha/beta fold hydrolase, partial [Azospirillaceae bacterium]|nr:alpha/beta fold hydrolase [Azospirillaceae bacterium]
MGRRVVFLIAGAFLSACAPRLQPMGPAVAEPRLTASAIIAADGYRLPLRRWTPEPGIPTRAVVLALHGFNDYSKSFDGPGGYFAGRGVAVYAYDQRGFGATRDPGVWAGGETLAADARAALTLLVNAHPGLPLFLMGESMGGAAAILALT